MAHNHTKDLVATELARSPHISIVDLLDALILHAHSCRASDIHLDPTEEYFRIRMRIDGRLENSFHFPKHLHSEMISRIKVISRLRTDEHQSAQDGRFRHTFSHNAGCIDVRVSIIPTYHGENAVLRLLCDKNEANDLRSLGFSAEDYQKITDALRTPNGMILVTGPTGSGKTTTLYSLIRLLNKPETSIVTIEDPIEYAMEHVRQIQINPHSGLHFSTGLRSILRQDPDVIMVGEIRDRETADIAVNCALTGHLLLSTMHTTDTATALPRLLDMGVLEYLVASTVRIIIGQRLVRKICPHCKKEIKLTPVQTESLLYSPCGDMISDNQVVWEGVGCDACDQSGYLGRLSVNEVLVVDDFIREAILRKSPAHQIKKIATERGMTTMLRDAFQKIESGETTITEILRVIGQ